MCTYTVKYANDYKVKITNNTLNCTYILDISRKDKDYLNELYYHHGQLKKDKDGNVLDLNTLSYINLRPNGQEQLITFQKVIGLYNADTLAYIITLLRYDGNKFSIMDNMQYLGSLGYDEFKKRH